MEEYWIWLEIGRLVFLLFVTNFKLTIVIAISIDNCYLLLFSLNLNLIDIQCVY